MWTDSRLLVTVCPPLEYKIPEMGKLTRSVILGDGDRDELRALCEQYVRPRGETSQSSGQLKKEGIQCAAVSSVERDEAVRTCSLVDEYLCLLAATWKRYLHELHLSVRRMTYSLRRKAEHIVSHPSSPPGSSARQEEMILVRKDLESTLRTLRERPVPSMPRPAALTEAVAQLRGVISKMERRVPKKDILDFKQQFETRVTAIERRIAARFATHLLGFLTTGSDS